MSERFLVRPEAEQDPCVWYERCSSGMGKEFLRCVDAAFAAIKRATEIRMD